MALERIWGNWQLAGFKAATTGNAKPKNETEAMVQAVAITDPTGVPVGGTGAIATGQAVAGAAASLIVPARPGRAAVTLINNTGSAVVRVGGATVTTSTGAYMPAVAGAQLTLATSAAIYAISAGADQTMSFIETY